MIQTGNQQLAPEDEIRPLGVHFLGVLYAARTVGNGETLGHEQNHKSRKEK
jgi:hypothetical protein